MLWLAVKTMISNISATLRKNIGRKGLCRMYMVRLPSWRSWKHISSEFIHGFSYNSAEWMLLVPTASSREAASPRPGSGKVLFLLPYHEIQRSLQLVNQWEWCKRHWNSQYHKIDSQVTCCSQLHCISTVLAT